MLEILGIIFLFIVGKFIFDTFLTNNTAKTKKWYKENYPEENYRLDKNEGLNLNVKPKANINDRQRSLEEVAINMNTTPELVKNKYIEQLKSKINSDDEKIYFFKTIRQKKIEEAKTKGIDPDDGVAALMEEWAKEHLNSVEKTPIDADIDSDDEITIKKATAKEDDWWNSLSEAEKNTQRLLNLKFIKAFEDKDSTLTFFIYHHKDSELTSLFSFNGEQFGATREMLTEYTLKNRDIGKKFFEFLEKEGINTSNYRV